MIQCPSRYLNTPLQCVGTNIQVENYRFQNTVCIDICTFKSSLSVLDESVESDKIENITLMQGMNMKSMT